MHTALWPRLRLLWTSFTTFLWGSADRTRQRNVRFCSYSRPQDAKCCANSHRTVARNLATGIIILATALHPHTSCAAFQRSYTWTRLRADQTVGGETSPADSHAQFGINVPEAINTIRPCQALAGTANGSSETSLSLRRQRAEWAVGHKLALEIERSAALITDSKTTEYLNSIEQNIVLSSALVGCFSVKLINDNDANAYSLPGGFLYVTSGMILMADSEAELAAVLAHETGHVTAQHITRIQNQRRIWGRLVLAGGPIGYLVRRWLGPLLTLKLLRNAEFEADRLSLKYHSASRYDPAEFSRLLQSEFQDEEKASFFERLLDEHPSTATRVKRLDKIRRGLSPIPTDYAVDTSEFQEIKRRISILTNLVQPDGSLSNKPQ